jgi:hypothetical protein
MKTPAPLLTVSGADRDVAVGDGAAVDLRHASFRMTIVRVLDLGRVAPDAVDFEFDRPMVFRPRSLPIAEQIALMIETLVNRRYLVGGAAHGHGRLFRSRSVESRTGG